MRHFDLLPFTVFCDLAELSPPLAHYHERKGHAPKSVKAGPHRYVKRAEAAEWLRARAEQRLADAQAHHARVVAAFATEGTANE